MSRQRKAEVEFWKLVGTEPARGIHAAGIFAVESHSQLIERALEILRKAGKMG